MPVYNNLEYVRIKRPLPEFIQKDKFGIPFIEPDIIDISNMNNGKWLVSLNNLSNKDNLASRKIVHSFKSDDVLHRWYNNPYKYLEKVAPYYAVSSFDFSMDNEMEYPMIVSAVFKNRWSGAFAQAHGKKVIPTVGWTIPEYYDLCFSGLRNGGVFLISTLGVNNKDSKDSFLQGYFELRRRFPDSRIICVGDRLREVDLDVCVVSYADSFGYWNRKNSYWQPHLIEWDGSIADRG